MKRIGILLVVLGLLFPQTICAAEEKKYVSQGLREVLLEEGFPFQDTSYEEDSKKANIYLFRGKGCEVCYEFLSYLNAMVPNYGSYFNLISYEVWGNVDNNELMQNVSLYYKEKATGVPYIIIGDHVWNGYSQDLNSEIYDAMMEEYENGNKNDHFAEAMQYRRENTWIELAIPLGAIVIVGGILIYKKQKNRKRGGRK